MVDNADAVRTQGRVAGLLETTGENSFKVHAHLLAASRAATPRREAGLGTLEE